MGSTANPEIDSWAWPELRETQRAVLLDVLIHGSRSRADLGRRARLSRAGVSRLMHELTDMGLVRETDTTRAGSRGRPSDVFQIDPRGAHFLGFKLTGDSLYAAVTDLSARVVRSEETALDSVLVEDVVELLADSTARLREQFPRLAAVGVCLAGDVRPDEDNGPVVVGSAFLGWDEVPLQRLVGRATGLPATISNDVQSLTTAHHWFGAGRGASSMALISVGAGIGCGLVTDGERIRGVNGRPGKVGHLPVGGQARCDVGHIGCVSSYVTIPAILRNSGAATFHEALEAARGGEITAREAIDHAAGTLGTVIATLANVIDPEMVVVTGEALEITTLSADATTQSVHDHLDPTIEAPEIVYHPFHFTDYAKAAAISAIRELI